MDKSVEFYNICISDLTLSTKNPEAFLEPNPVLCKNLKDQLKEIYDFTKKSEIKVVKSSALPELIVRSFESEQIWQQIELQNGPLLDRSITTVSKLIAGKDRLIFTSLENKHKEVTLQEELVENKSDDEESDASINDNDAVIGEKQADNSDLDENLNDADLSPSESFVQENQPTQQHAKKSVVDDEFFKLDEMENFLRAEEKKANDPDSGNDSESSESESEGSVDLFEAGSEDEEDKVRTARYKDFFVAQDDVKKEKRNKFLEEMEESDTENYKEPKSSFELRQERLTERIAAIEENAVTEKPWQLKGEITGENRPQNSLLQEIVEFDMTTRPAPIITEQTSMQLEDIIRRRIKDKIFDSVERKAKPVETPLEYKKKLVLDQEKSKQSLAQIYEKDYLDQKAALDPENAEKEEEVPELHKTVNTMMDSLFRKLDALSNYHFTPKPAAPELKIISNLPAISMEEVAPVATSDAALLAPEEVKGKTRGDAIGKEERTVTDKKRERRKKKQKQKVHVMEKLKREESRGKIKPGSRKTFNKDKKSIENLTKNKNINKMNESVKIGKSSKAFFARLEEEAKAQINRSGVKRSKTKNEINAKKLKL